MDLHKILHPTVVLSESERVLWIHQNAVEKYSDERKTFYTDDELNEFRRQSVDMDNEATYLGELVDGIKTMLRKGCDCRSLVLPTTVGVDRLNKYRRKLNEAIKQGYLVEPIMLYGFPCADTEYMLYFEENGTQNERARALSQQEINKYLGMFAKRVSFDVAASH